MIDRRSPNDKLLAVDASRIQEAAGGQLEIAIVLGSGLSSAFRDAFTHVSIPYDTLLGMPVATLRGHAGEVLAGNMRGKKVAVFAGRVHLYQGFSPSQVTTSVRLAYAAGAHIVILTNAAGSLRDDVAPGDIMMIKDHLNLTGRNPLVGWPYENPFVDMADAYSSRLRAIVQTVAAPAHRLREGVYAGLQGPELRDCGRSPLLAHDRRGRGRHVNGARSDLRALPEHGRSGLQHDHEQRGRAGHESPRRHRARCTHRAHPGRLDLPIFR